MRPHVATLQLAPTTETDIASIPNDPLRGCKWTDAAHNENWGLTQVVANWDSLSAYQRRHRSITTWLPNSTINNRAVGIFREPQDSCGTYVQSGRAGVITTVIRFSRESSIDECAKAIEATTAVIDQIPR